MLPHFMRHAASSARSQTDKNDSVITPAAYQPTDVHHYTKPRLLILSTGIAVSLLLFLFMVISSPAHALGQTNTKGLFGSQEVRSDRLVAFRKWTEMLKRNTDHMRGLHLKGPCRVTISFKCPEDEWKSYLGDLHNQDDLEKIKAINSYMNRAPYITDPRNWGVKDYWATLKEFFLKDGDCEDYAIAKYFSLKALGIAPEQMRIAVVEDMNLKSPHAVLVVNLKGQNWILDNQIPTVVKENAVYHYRPIYSINETAWWLHRM